jgi:hypothetical protein
MRRVEDQREIQFGGESSEAGETGFRLRVDGGVFRALSVPGQADFSDCADRVALARDHFEHGVGFDVGLFEALGMKSEGWMHDAGILAREVDDFAIRLGTDAGHDYRRHIRVKRALDTGRRVGILVSVEMNVRVDHISGVIITAAGRAGIAR